MEGTSICLLTCDRPRKLELCAGIIRASCVDPYELIIIDNGSTDHCQAAVLKNLELDPHVKVIRNDTNLGLSRGVNQGFEAAQYPYLIHIEDDIVFQAAGWNRVMVDYFQRFSEIGTIAPDRGYSKFIQRNGYREIDWHLGMCWGIRREVLDKIGEAYDVRLLHQNECDLCLRVRMAGYRCAIPAEFHPGSCVHDDGGGEPSELAQSRMAVGTFMFRDKWAKYFLGDGYDGCFTPLYMWEDYPVNQEFMRELALSLEINKTPEHVTLALTEWDVIKRLKSLNSYGEPDWRRGEYLRANMDALKIYHDLTGVWMGDVEWWPKQTKK